jgi:hypothetical protein
MEITDDNPNLPASEIYGAEHLLRFCGLSVGLSLPLCVLSLSLFFCQNLVYLLPSSIKSAHFIAHVMRLVYLPVNLHFFSSSLSIDAAQVPTAMSKEGLEMSDKQISQVLSILSQLVEYLDRHAEKLFVEDYVNVLPAYFRLSQVT